MLYTAAIHNINKPVTFTFTLPLPKKIARKNNINRFPQIKKVIIVGNFSSWDIRNDAFRMQKHTNNQGKHKWSISLRLQSGKTKYKFIVYIKGRKNFIWTHNKNAGINERNRSGTFNSVYYIRNYSSFYKISSIILLTLLGLIIVYSLFELLLSLLLKKQIKSFHRHLLFFVLLLLISNTGIIWFNVNQQKQLTRMSYKESLHLIHTFLLSHGVDFTQLDVPATRKILHTSLQKFFRLLKARVLQPSYLTTETTLHHIGVFTTDFQLIGFADRKQQPFRHSNKISKEQYAASYFSEWVFGKMIQNIRKNPAKGLSYQYGEMQRCQCKNCRKRLKTVPFYTQAPILGYNTILAPIYRNMQIHGYYGLVILPQLYAARITASIWANVIWSFCLILFSLFFFIIRPPNLGFSKKSFEKFCKKHKITKREQEIIEHIAKGTNYHKVGKMLFISLKTVKAHVYNIYQKAEVNNRVELINRIRDIA